MLFCRFPIFFLFLGFLTQARPLATSTRTPQKITLDGMLSEAAWKEAVVVRDFREFKTDRVALRGNAFRFLYDEQALYVALACDFSSRSAQLVPPCKARKHDEAAYADECVELYLQPDPAEDYYHLVWNMDGVRYDGKGFDSSFNPAWEVKTRTGEKGWTSEVRIPFTSLNLAGRPADGIRWRMNLTRNDAIHSQYATWSPLSKGFHEPASFGELQFLEGCPGISLMPPRRHGGDLLWTLPVSEKAEGLVVQISLRTLSGQYDLKGKPGKDGGAIVLRAADAWSPDGGVRCGTKVFFGKRLVYRSEPTVQLGTRVPLVQSEGVTPLIIGNGKVSLTFDRNSGSLLKMSNRESGLEVDFGREGTPVAELEAVRFLRNPGIFQDEDVQTIVPGGETLREAVRTVDEKGERISIRHFLEGGAELVLTVTVPKKGVETWWDIELDNRRGLRPSQSLVFHRVRYPCMFEVPEGICGSEPQAVVPRTMGQRIPSPAKNLRKRRSYPYIGPTTQGWFDYSGSAGGLYFMTAETGALPQTDLILWGDAETATVTLGIERWALAKPGQRWTPGSCRVAPHAGDWHTGADLYRDWFRRNIRTLPTPKWLREAQGFVMSGGPGYEFSQLPRILANAQAMGISYIQLWSQMTGGDISYHAFGYPNPYMGTEKELEEAIRELHRAGGHIGVYLNYNTGDPLLGTFVRQPRLAQKIPARIPRPALDYMKDNWVHQALLSHSGSYSMWSTSVPGYLDDYWNMCPAADKWSGLYKYWVVDLWAKRYKLDVWYLDSCPVSRGSPCFATDHGHAEPMPEGQAIMDFYAHLRAGVSKDFGIMQEYSSDRLLQWGTHALGLMWHAKFAHPEVVRYALPEMILFSGMCNGYGNVKQFYNDEKVTYIDALERVFLIGNRFELSLSHQPPSLVSEYKVNLVALRRACTSEMNYGDFLDDIGIGTLPERVHARLFRAPDRKRLAMTLLDRRAEADKTAFSLKLDLAGTAAGMAEKTWLRTLKGKIVPLKPVLDGKTLTLEIPVFADRPAALFIETTGGGGK